ncbi:tryptophan synthase beta subunit-like PLP-dependent enzyme [Dipodascopsis uninucleata]
MIVPKEKESSNLSRKGVEEAYDIIRPFVKRTPVLTNESISKIATFDENRPIRLFFKCENFQKGGAFKIRGATNAIEKLSAEELSKGVITHSSGNHAQALAIAAQRKRAKAYIVMPSNSALPKIAGTKAYGGDVYFSGPSAAERESVVSKIQVRSGAKLIPPYDHPDVILGQGTTMLELLEQTQNDYSVILDAVVIPVGGGGLLAGCALAAQGTGVKVYASEPALADDCFRGFESKERVTKVSTTTIADGLRTPVGITNFPIILNNVEKVFTVSETEIQSAMRLIWERMKIIVEPSSAVPLAAILSDAWRREGIVGNIGLVISGGNVDLDSVSKLLLLPN